MTLTDPAQLKAPKRVRMPSVTTIIDALVPKPALVPWAEAQTAEGMLTLLRAGELDVRMTAAEALATMREAKIGAEGVRTTAARRGVDVHALLERYARDGAWADPVGVLDPEDFGYAHALNDWLRAKRPQPAEIEQLVCDPEWSYAGRLDLIADIDGMRTLVDLATSESAAIYEGKHLQTRLYHRAAMACGSDPCDRLLVVVVAKDGAWREMDCLMTDNGAEDALRFHRALRPVVSACAAANRTEKDARTEPAEPKAAAVKVDYREDDESTHPGATRKRLARYIPGVGRIDFEEAPVGWTTKDGTRRGRDWRAYWFTPEPTRIEAAA